MDWPSKKGIKKKCTTKHRHILMENIFVKGMTWKFLEIDFVAGNEMKFSAHILTQAVLLETGIEFFIWEEIRKRERQTDRQTDRQADRERESRERETCLRILSIWRKNFFMSLFFSILTFKLFHSFFEW